MTSTNQVANAPRGMKLIASVFGLGYSPFASGTVASAAVCLPALFFSNSGLTSSIVWLSIGIICAFLGIAATARVQSEWGTDPSKVVIDEVAGMALVLAAPLTVSSPWWILTGFLFFRLYDIAKPFPANIVNSRTEPWSVMVDDLIAAIYAVVSVYIWQVVLNVVGPLLSS